VAAHGASAAINVVGPRPAHPQKIRASKFVPHVSLLLHARYQRAGQGHASAKAMFLADVPDPRGWLEARLGPLISFEIEKG
jgi:hypothetical protein